MGFEQAYLSVLRRIPGVKSPLGKLTFKDKLKWTGMILVIYFVMTQVIILGISETSFEQFRILETLLGASFGSLMTLGIGPIVTASIILQLLVGSKIIPWDLQSETGKAMFQGTQKLLAVLFSFAEAFVFVSLGAIPPASPELWLFVVLQLALGGIIVIFMDELISKWGFGSGVGLFIVAGVAKTIIIRMFNPLTQAGTFPTPGNPPAGHLPFAITAMSLGEPFQAFVALIPVIATFLVFFLVVYAQAIKVEVPLAFGSIRGFGRRWPLKFFYTSNIPVILVAALLANVGLMGNIFSQQGIPIFGNYDEQGFPQDGLGFFLQMPQTSTGAGLSISFMFMLVGVFALIGVLLAYFTNRPGWKMGIIFTIIGFFVWLLSIFSFGLTSLLVVGPLDIIRIFTYSGALIIGAVIFSYFWMSTSGMDSKSVAGQIQSTGMQIPGYRRDVRIIEKVLDRYIPALTVIGGAAVGALAAYADFTGALGTGTGILLATMIIYQLYEELAMQHMQDMHPALRRFME